MPLLLYNTLTRKKEVFHPSGNEVRMYNCGPTVYDYAHIGNFRAYIFADLLRRYLEWKGSPVKQVMNITDVGHMTADDQLEVVGEDKIEKAARIQGVKPREIADFYMMAFFEDIAKLNVRKAFFYPRATNHVPEMQEIILQLIRNGYAYVRRGNVYFEVKKFKGYGKLSGNTIKKLHAGKRIAVRDEKKDPLDFALWIRNPKHLMQWDSPWGQGYPGWHVECTAMSLKYLGEDFDIHTGGEDNIFPHHECEIAQAEGADKKFVRVWMHTRHLLVNGQKMSKSLGNFFTLRDLVTKGHSPREVRFLLLTAHYRTKINFTEKGLLAARETIQTLDNVMANLKGVTEKRKTPNVSLIIKETRKEFEKAMDDDLNIPLALSHLFEFVRKINTLISRGAIGKESAQEAVNFFLDIDRILGLDLDMSKQTWTPPEETEGKILELIEEREKFRKDKNFKEADRIREKLRKMRILIEDSDKGPRWRKNSK